MRVYLASAGTGKTHALVEELKGLIQSGVPLRRIAALTFTRKAAEELRGRAKRAVLALSAEDPRLKEAEREVHGALFTTIHGFMAEALRHTAPLLGLDPDFALLDAFLAEALFLEEARSLLYRKGLDGGLAGALLHLYRKRTLAETLHPLPGAEGVFALYLEALEGYRRRLPAFLSPSDLEALALRILENREALRRVVERFPHILLDEYQDTGPLQGRFFQGLKEAWGQAGGRGGPQAVHLPLPQRPGGGLPGSPEAGPGGALPFHHLPPRPGGGRVLKPLHRPLRGGGGEGEAPPAGGGPGGGALGGGGRGAGGEEAGRGPPASGQAYGPQGGGLRLFADGGPGAKPE